MYLLSGQFISQIGDKFYALALAFWVMETTKSAAAMGTVMLFSMLPSVITGFLLSGFVDRNSRKAILITADIIRGFTIAVVIAVFYFKALTLPVIILVQVVLSISSAFFNPAVLVIIPQIVEKEQLTRANALSQLVYGLTLIIGPVVGGLAVAYIGYWFVFVFNAVSFFISAFFNLLLKVQVLRKNEENRKGKLRVIEGYKYIFEKRDLVVIIAIVAIVHFFVGAFQVAIPTLAVSLQGSGAQNLGFLDTSFGLGAVGAGLLLSTIKLNNKEEKVIFLSISSIGVFYFIIGVVNRFGINVVWPYMVAFMLLGIVIILASTCYKVIIQQSVENEMIGRVFGIVTSIGNGSIPVAAFIFSILTDILKFNLIAIFSGAMLLLISIPLYRAFIANKTVQNAD
jgi:Major Facilitator Superfamily.